MSADLTGTTVPGQQTGAVPEPALRPRDAPFPDRYITRRARVYLDRGGDGTAIVIRGPRGQQRRIPAGPGGVTRLVLDPPSPGPGTVLGSLTLTGDGGQALARLPLAFWRPEAMTDYSVSPTVQGPVDMSSLDIAAFAAETGLPLTDNRMAASGGHDPGSGGEPDLARRTREPRRRPARDPAVVIYQAEIPAWYEIARVLLSLVWIAAFFALVFAPVWRGGAGAYHALTLLCALTALALPLLYVSVLARAWWLDRASGRPPRAVDATLVPHPHRAVPRRFLRTASLRLLPAELVATSDDGAERWLPRSGPTAVTELVTVTVHGRRDRVELRTADGRARAVLPWEYWFSGSGGDQALSAFAAAAGLPLTRAEGQRIPRSADTLWAYRPVPPGSDFTMRPWSGLPADNDLFTFSFFAAMSAIGAFMLGPPPALAVAVAGIVFSAAPRFIRRRVRHWRLRAVQPGEAR